MMVSVAALERDRSLRSAFWCALGARAKIFPAVVMPVAILTVPWLIVGPNSLRSFLRFTVARESWETIWTFPHTEFPPTPTERA